MLLYFVESVKNMVQQYHYSQNSSLYPNGYSYTYKIPRTLVRIEMSIINVVYKQPIMFIIPSIFFWFSKPITGGVTNFVHFGIKRHRNANKNT